MILALSIAMTGCAARKIAAGHAARIPGCSGAYAFVPKGCYLQSFEDRIEVRCPDSTTKFRRCVPK